MFRNKSSLNYLLKNPSRIEKTISWVIIILFFCILIFNFGVFNSINYLSCIMIVYIIVIIKIHDNFRNSSLETLGAFITAQPLSELIKEIIKSFSFYSEGYDMRLNILTNAFVLFVLAYFLQQVYMKSLDLREDSKQKFLENIKIRNKLNNPIHYVSFFLVDFLEKIVYFFLGNKIKWFYFSDRSEYADSDETKTLFDGYAPLILQLTTPSGNWYDVRFKTNREGISVRKSTKTDLNWSNYKEINNPFFYIRVMMLFRFRLWKFLFQKKSNDSNSLESFVSIFE